MMKKDILHSDKVVISGSLVDLGGLIPVIAFDEVISI